MAEAKAHDIPGLKTAVHIDGTLNKDDDVDNGYSVEVAIPLASIPDFGDIPPTLPPSELTSSGLMRQVAKLSAPLPSALLETTSTTCQRPEKFASSNLRPSSSIGKKTCKINV